jgi:predicted phage replisome organizer
MVDMFEHDKIEFIRSLPEGDAIIVIWVQMLAIAGKCNSNGYLMITDDIPYTEELLCTKLRRTPVIFKFAMDTLMRLKMVTIDEQSYYISNWEKHQNVQGMEKIRSDTAKRVAKHREKKKEQKLLQSNVTNSLHVTISNETEEEVEEEKEKKTSSSGETYRVFQNSIGMINATTRELLDDDIETYGNEMVQEAIKEAARQGKNKLSYVEGILTRWHTDGRGSSTVGRTGQAAHHKEQTPEEWAASINIGGLNRE